MSKEKETDHISSTSSEEVTNEFPILDLEKIMTDNIVDPTDETTGVFSEIVVEPPELSDATHLIESAEDEPAWDLTDADNAEQQSPQNPPFQINNERPSKISGLDTGAKLGLAAIAVCTLIGVSLIAYVLLFLEGSGTQEVKEEPDSDFLSNSSLKNTEDLFLGEDQKPANSLAYDSPIPETQQRATSSSSSIEETTSTVEETTTTGSVETTSTEDDTTTTNSTTTETSETDTTDNSVSSTPSTQEPTNSTEDTSEPITTLQ